VTPEPDTVQEFPDAPEPDYIAQAKALQPTLCLNGNSAFFTGAGLSEWPCATFFHSMAK